MKIAARHSLALVAALMLVGCGADSDSIVVVKVSAAPGLPPVVQLRGVFSNAGAGAERSFPTSGGSTPISFPTSFSVTLPPSRQGALDVALEGLDPGGAVVAGGTTRVVIARGTRVEVEVALAAGAPACGNRRSDPGESCDDGNRVSGDGCSFVCQVEADAAAPPGADAGFDAKPVEPDATSDAVRDLGVADAPADLTTPDAGGLDVPADAPDGGACVPGTRQACYTGPAGTMGHSPCKAGTTFCNDKSLWEPCEGEVKPRPETCNGQDEDCDGIADNGLGGMQTCGVGECKRTVASCANGRQPLCTPGAPVPEVCNGKDDDCNGSIDEGKHTCGVGACKQTVDKCANGAPVTCVPGSPKAETCNAIDDDCNDLVDDGAANIWPSCSHQSGYSCMQFTGGVADCCVAGGTEQDCLAGLYTWRNGVCCE
jgi:cysteine-rich repeat protein